MTHFQTNSQSRAQNVDFSLIVSGSERTFTFCVSNLVTFNKYISTSASQMMMHNEVEGVDWTLQLSNIWKTDFSFWSWTGAFLLSIMDVNIAFCGKNWRVC